MVRENYWKRAAAAALVVIVAACGGGGGGGSSSAPTPPSAPAISAQPQGVTVVDGASASFSVSVAGTQPLSFQWQRNGTNIDGATGPSYLLAAASLADNGAKFSVTVSNAAGTAASQAATLTVSAIAPMISAQPQNASADDGATASFAVTASGSNPLAYQWMKNGLAIAGATNPSYTTLDLALADDRSQYTVVVSNPAGSVTSSAATVAVRPVVPSFVATPQSLTARDGSAVTLVSTAKGSAPLGYQWLRNGVAIAGATGASYSFTAQLADNGARYAVSVSNAFGTAVSAVATLKVDANAPAFSAQPADVVATTGASASFSASASGTAPLVYQWQRSDDGGFEWTNIAGATSASFNIPALTMAWSKVALRVVVSNGVGSVASQTARLTVQAKLHILAGSVGGEGYADGQGALARFYMPNSVAADASGNIYVADLANKAIRKVAPSFYVSTLTTFNNMVPVSVAIGSNGVLYAASPASIVKIDANGATTLLAGLEGVSGSADGAGSEARFLEIRAIAVDASGNVWVNDGSNRLVRRVTPDGVVTTIAGKLGQYGRVDGKGAAAQFGDLTNIVTDASGNAYVADGPAIRKITPDGTVTRFAGSYDDYGSTDGDRMLAARFINVRGLAFDNAGNLYVAELGDIRRIGTDGQTVTVAGNGSSGYNVSQYDGSGAAARFQGANGLTVLPSQNTLAFADGSVIRTVTTGGKVTTVAGSPALNGLLDARGSDARFTSPGTVVAAPSGTLYVLDRMNVTVRKVLQSGFASTPTNYRFTTAYSLAVDAAENVYVSGTNVVYKMRPDGSASILAGKQNVSGGADGAVATATFNTPYGIAVDGAGNVWISDVQDHTIRKISNTGVVTTVAGQRGTCGYANGSGSDARFCGPATLAFDAAGNLIISEQSGVIRRMTPDGTVSTVAGVAFSTGFSDGASARFGGAVALAGDANGNLFVADGGNNLIRKIAPNGYTSTIMGVRGGRVLSLSVDGAVNNPQGVAVTSDGRLFITSENAVVGD